MKRKLISVVVGTVVAVGTCSALVGEKVDVSKVITRADAQQILGTPVQEATGRNKDGADGFYDSEWRYRAVKGDKALMLDLLIAGQDAPPNLTKTMFSVLPSDGGKSTPIDRLGDKAIFCPNETGMAMLHVLKDDILITIGIHGLPANAVLEQEKAVAAKILAHL